MKSFEVPIIYRSPLITAIKNKRREEDRMKKPASLSGRDFSPVLLDFGPLHFYLARHFGFCYGVENAIEIAFRTVRENPGKKIYLLSEMIHNPQVNADLKSHGVEFIQDTYGRQLIPFEKITAEDIVLIPAFGTTLEIEEKLNAKGIRTEKYDTTCPFVEKVWNRSEAIAKKNYSIIIHGKPGHEETRATFSRASSHAPSIVIKDLEEAKELAKFISGERTAEDFYSFFEGQYSAGFDIKKDLERIGVVNQTTMLASDTQEIAEFLKKVVLDKYQVAQAEDHFADTRDTLCYATNDNQTSVNQMLKVSADLAIVVGGYNSSNTSHLVELCEKQLPTYFISSEEKIISKKEILHFDLYNKEEILTLNYMPSKTPVKVLITCGASCPDALVEDVINKLASYFEPKKSVESLIKDFS